MEYLNRIELRGIIGSARISSYEGKRMAQFTVATTVYFRSFSGETILDTTWHTVTAWEGPNISLEGLEKGAKVYVMGRVKNSTYTASDGEQRHATVIIASRIGFPGDIELAPQEI